MRMVDLSQEIFSGLPVYRGHQPTIIHRLRNVQNLPDGKWTFAVNALMISDHCGTHVDAFVHMDPSPDARAMHQLPLEMHHGPGICIDVSHVPSGDFITKDDVMAACARAGLQVPKDGHVLVYTGHYGRNFPKPPYSDKHPGLDRAATEWLAEQGAVNIGIDCPAVDVEPHKGEEWKPSHMVCREQGVLNTENLGDLTEVVGKAFYYMGLPLNIRNGTAAPIRAVAILDGWKAIAQGFSK